MEACWLFKTWSSSALHRWREYLSPRQPAPVLCSPCVAKISWYQPKMPLPQGRSMAACPTRSEEGGPGWEVSVLKMTGDWSVWGEHFSCACPVPLLPQMSTLVLSETWSREASFWSDAACIFLGHKIQFIAFFFTTAFSVLEECY